MALNNTTVTKHSNGNLNGHQNLIIIIINLTQTISFYENNLFYLIYLLAIFSSVSSVFEALISITQILLHVKAFYLIINK